MSWVPAGHARSELVVFLPGTGGKPRANFPFALSANDLGYHVICLMYPYDIAAQQDCINSALVD